MVTRRQAREWAVMMLCECDLNPPESIETALSAFWVMQSELEFERVKAGEYGVREAFTGKGKKHMASLVNMQEFAEQRIRGVLNSMNEIDTALEPCLENWEFYRLGTVERSVLRLGAWEILHANDIPAAIVINEAVDLARFFSDSLSSKLVNGVLDRLARSLSATQPASAE